MTVSKLGISEKTLNSIAGRCIYIPFLTSMITYPIASHFPCVNKLLAIILLQPQLLSFLSSAILTACYPASLIQVIVPQTDR